MDNKIQAGKPADKTEDVAAKPLAGDDENPFTLPADGELVSSRPVFLTCILVGAVCGALWYGITGVPEGLFWGGLLGLPMSLPWLDRMEARRRREHLK